MTVGSATAQVGQTAIVTIELKDVPPPGILGYAFKLDYNDEALSRAAGTTAGCMFEMEGPASGAVGRSPYYVACVYLSSPGTYVPACSPGPCTLATVVFVCNRQGVFPLTLDVSGPDASAYADGRLVPLPVFAENGAITCGSPAARSGANLRL